MSQDIQCARCNRQMHFVNQFKVGNHDTFGYHCVGCNGKVYMQQRQHPQTKQMVWVSVQLTGNPNEFRPQSIRPNEQVQIPVAYTLGNAPANRGRVQAPPIPMPDVAYSLNPRQEYEQLPLNHPMHPANLRRAMQPVRLEEFGG